MILHNIYFSAKGTTEMCAGCIGQGLNLPYEGVPFKPDGDDKCVACGECRRICSQNAISEGDFRKTDNELCIACGACIKVCPAGARNYHCEAYEEVKKDFEKMCSEYRVPELFYIEEAE